jgi:hypothetical protein
MTFADRGSDPDALLTDQYLESLLSADRHAADAPADARLDPAIRDVARRLRRHLVPVHPSFRFEERLATRLAQAASSMRLAAAAGAEDASLAAQAPEAIQPFEDLLDDDFATRARPLLIGGALTSAALSIAGAAFVAWRRTRTSRRQPPIRVRLD